MNTLVQQLIYEQKNRMRINNARLRDMQDPFQIPECRFVDIYRMPQSIVFELIEEIEPFFEEGTKVNTIPLHFHVLTALNFYASGSYQSRVGLDNRAAVSQASVSRIIKNMSHVISTHLADKYIVFPEQEEDIQTVKNGFLTDHGFPGVIGLIDGTHVAVAGISKQDEYAYVNRKGYHSINVQIICDSNMRILNANARYSGSSHDSNIWRNSYIHSHLEQNNRGESWLLGDSGYPLQPWLMTPIPRPSSAAERSYNRSQILTRSKVERCIGQLKATFRCIIGERKLKYNHEKAGKIIYSCVTLHNFLKTRGYRPRVNPDNAADAILIANGIVDRPNTLRNNYNDLVQNHFRNSSQNDDDDV